MQESTKHLFYILYCVLKLKTGGGGNYSSCGFEKEISSPLMKTKTPL